MKFILAPWDLNKLMKFAKNYITSDTIETPNSLIQCEVNNTTIKAYCIEGYRACEITLPIEEFEGEVGKCFLPPLNKHFLIKDGNIDVIVEENEVTYQNKVCSQTFKVKQAQQMFPTKRIWEESSSEIHFHPRRLLEALQPFASSNEPILIEVVEEKGFIITQTEGDCKYRALTLGVKVQKGNK